MHEIENISEISHELIYHRYILSRGQTQNLFKDISMPEYIALHRISNSVNGKTDGSGKVYLKEIAEELHLTVSKTSKLIGGLRDKGFVFWSHDGNGSEGTYITITESGLRLLEKQEGLLKEYYGKVIENFGQENMAKLLQLTVQLEAVMYDELKNIGDDTDEI